MLPRQCIWRDNVIGSRQRRWRDQKVKSANFLGAIIIKISNKK
jgi:hypothetical protein